jgi:outer membrane protein TolC
MRNRTLLSLIFCLLLFELAPAQKKLTLEEALNIAMANSPDIRQVELNLERSRESLKAQQAALKSNFSLTVTPFSYDRSRTFNTYFGWKTNETKTSESQLRVSQPLKWTDGTLSLYNRFNWQDSYSEVRQGRDKTYSNYMYLTYAQPIFTYNRTMLQLKGLELELENNLLNYGIQKMSLERLVTQAFYKVYSQKLSHQIAIEEYQNQQQSHEIINNKVAAGLVAQEELYQAELNLASSKSKVQDEQVNLENSLDDFKKLLGISLFDDIDVIGDVTHMPVTVDLQKALDTGLKTRMELRQRQISVDLAQAELVRTSATNEFKGDLQFTYGIIGSDPEFKNVYEVPTRNQRYQLSLEIPLFDWGEKASRIRAEKASVRSQELNLEDLKNDIIIGIRQAFRTLNNQEMQIEIAQQNIRNAQLTYDINLERYRNGDLTSMDLSLYQNQLSQKKIGLVDALINYKIALLNLKIQSMWDFTRSAPVLPELQPMNN